MEAGKFGLVAKTKKGCLERIEGSDVHVVKSYAGHMFQLPHVKSVCVFDWTGFVPLYLRKNPDGTIYREEREIQ